MFRELNPLLHSELRLAVMSILIGVESADFVFIRQQTGATAGNLSVQLDKLSRAGYITVEKTFRGKMPARSAASPMRGATPLRSMSRRCKATSGQSKADARRHAQAQPANTRGGAARVVCRTEGPRRPCSEPKEAARIACGTEGSRKPCSKRKKGRRNHAPNRRAAETARGAERSRTDRTERAARGLKEPGNARKGPAGGAPHGKIRAGVYRTIHPGPNCRKGSSRKGAPNYCCAPDSASCMSF